MATITVHVRSLERVLPDMGKDEFYRTYEVPGVEGGLGVWQYGSQRSGRTGGAFMLKSLVEARSKIGSKQREGYKNVAEYRFQMDDSALTSLLADLRARAQPEKVIAKAVGGVLETMRQTTEMGQKESKVKTLSGQSMGGTATTSRPKDSLDALASDLQKAIADIVANPKQAFSKVKEFRDKLQIMDDQTQRIRSFYETLELLAVDVATGA